MEIHIVLESVEGACRCSLPPWQNLKNIFWENLRKQIALSSFINVFEEESFIKHFLALLTYSLALRSSNPVGCLAWYLRWHMNYKYCIILEPVTFQYSKFIASVGSEQSIEQKLFDAELNFLKHIHKPFTNSKNLSVSKIKLV